MKTLTEKRFFEWHEDDKSVTLRNRGGRTEEAQKFWLSAIPRQSRSVMCHRLQMGAARTSYARETDSMREVVGVDVFNFALTDGVGRCLSTSGGGLNEHIPIVIITEQNEE